VAATGQLTVSSTPMITGVLDTVVVGAVAAVQLSAVPILDLIE
jgi:hypothetical protein